MAKKAAKRAGGASASRAAKRGPRKGGASRKQAGAAQSSSGPRISRPSSNKAPSARRSSTATPAPIDLDRLSIVPATGERWPDLEQLFGERGACGGCWCMVWRKPSRVYQADKGPKNRASLRKIVTGGAEPGVIAYDGERAIGWCAVAPRQVYVRLANSRVLAPVDDEPVWSISCLFVLAPYRRRGVSVALVRAAVRHAAEQGAKWVEAYPTVSRTDSAPAAFVWTGLPGTFERAGFVEVARRSSTRPIYRMPTAARDM